MEGNDLSAIVTVLMSAVQGNGAKYVATNLATEVKRKENEKKVLLVDFDFENPFLAHAFIKHDEVHGIDNLINNITDDGLSDELFLEDMIQTKMGVDVLRGTRFIEKVKMFSKQHIQVILEKAKQHYHYVFIVVNAKANNAGTIVSLMEADKVLMVLRNNYANLLKVERVLKLIKQYSTVETVHVAFNFKNLNSKLDINEKFENYNVVVLEVLEYDEKSIDNLNLEKKESVFSKSMNSKAINKMTKLLFE